MMLAERPFLRRLLFFTLVTTAAAAAIAIPAFNGAGAPPPMAPPTATAVGAPPPATVAARPVRQPLAIPVGAYHVAVDDTHVYWTAAGGEGEMLWRAPLDTGIPDLLSKSAGYSFALDGDAVYYTSRVRHEIHRIDLSDGRDRVLAHVADDPVSLVVGGDFVYWTVWNRKFVQRVATEGGAVASLPVASARDPIAADGAYFYAIDHAIGRVIRVAHGETKPQTLASGVRDAFDLVVSGDALYFTQDSSLYRLASSGGGVPKRLGTAGQSHALAVGPDAIYWTSWAGKDITPNGGCDSFNLGVLRRIDLLDDSSEIVATGCNLRGAARSQSAMFLLEMDRLVAREATCGDVAASARDRELGYRLEGGELVADAAASASVVADAFHARCIADDWSQAAIDCLGSPSARQPRTCDTLMSAAQRARLTDATTMMTSRD